MTTFGKTLKDLRTQKKMSIQELAKKSGLSAVSISNYENEHSKPNSISIQKLAKALKVKYDVLYLTK